MNHKRLLSVITVTLALAAGAALLVSQPADAQSNADCQANRTDQRLQNTPVFYAKRGQYWYAKTQPFSGPADLCFIFGLPGDIGIVGDWNGDGLKTPGVFRPSDASWHLSDSSFAAQVDGTFSFGSPGDIPIPGDWNNDGIETLGVFRAREGRWYITDHDRSGVAQRVYHFATPTDIPLTLSGSTAATTDLWVYRPSTAQWFHATINRNTGASGVDFFTYGLLGDRPVGESILRPGCEETPIVFRPSNGTWYSQQTDPFQYGNPTDHMLVSPIVRPQACSQ